MDGIRLLEEEGFSWGVIYVVTRLSLARPVEIFQFLSNLSPKGAFMFNPVLVYTPDFDAIRISPEEYADFLGAIFPTWWSRRNELPHIEPFAFAGHQLARRRKVVDVLQLGDVRLSAHQRPRGWKPVALRTLGRLGIAQLRLDLRYDVRPGLGGPAKRRACSQEYGPSGHRMQGLSFLEHLSRRLSAGRVVDGGAAFSTRANGVTPRRDLSKSISSRWCGPPRADQPSRSLQARSGPPTSARRLSCFPDESRLSGRAGRRSCMVVGSIRSAASATR